MKFLKMRSLKIGAKVEQIVLNKKNAAVFWKQDSKNSHNALIQPVLSLPFVQCELYCLLKLTLASYSRRYCSGRALCSPQNPFTENIVARHEPMHCAEVARGQKLQKKRNYMNPRKVYSFI